MNQVQSNDLIRGALARVKELQDDVKKTQASLGKYDAELQPLLKFLQVVNTSEISATPQEVEACTLTNKNELKVKWINLVNQANCNMGFSRSIARDFLDHAFSTGLLDRYISTKGVKAWVRGRKPNIGDHAVGTIASLVTSALRRLGIIQRGVLSRTFQFCVPSEILEVHETNYPGVRDPMLSRLLDQWEVSRLGPVPRAFLESLTTTDICNGFNRNRVYDWYRKFRPHLRPESFNPATSELLYTLKRKGILEQTSVSPPTYKTNTSCIPLRHDEEDLGPRWNINILRCLFINTFRNWNSIPRRDISQWIKRFWNNPDFNRTQRLSAKVSHIISPLLKSGRLQVTNSNEDEGITYQWSIGSLGVIPSS